MGMVSVRRWSFLPLCGLEVWQVWQLGRVHVVVDGQVLEVPQGEVAHFAAKDSEWRARRTLWWRTGQQQVWCQKRLAERWPASHWILLGSQVVTIWRPTRIKSLEYRIENTFFALVPYIEPGGSKGANLKETHQFPDFTLASTRANQLQDHAIWFNLPTSGRGYQSGASPNSCRKRSKSQNKTRITNPQQSPVLGNSSTASSTTRTTSKPQCSVDKASSTISTFEKCWVQLSRWEHQRHPGPISIPLHPWRTAQRWGPHVLRLCWLN